MQYNPPTGSTDSNAPYVGKNLAAGQQGSKIPPTMPELTQREIVAVITASGLSPTNSDTQQLLQAVRGNTLSFYVDTGTADALVITPSPAYTAVPDGTEFAVSKNTAVGANATAAPTLTVNGITCPIVKQDGTALSAGDLPAGAIFSMRSLNGAFRVSGVRKSDVSFTGAGAVTLAQTLIANFPSISPPRNSLVKKVVGSFTFTVGVDCPANVTELYVTVVGGGGPGAGGGGPSCTWSGGGGGSGGYAADWLAVTNGQAFTGIVGGGGTPSGTGNGNQGVAGGTSSFGTTLQATGGGAAIGGTATCAGGIAGQGSGSGLGFNFPGGNGGDGNSGMLTIQGGAGASSAFGGGGRTSTLNNAAINGLAPGSGAGGIWQNNASAQLGGTGAAGLVLIQW